DVRAVAPLVSAAKSADREVARLARVGLRRMGWEAVICLSDDAEDLVIADVDSHDIYTQLSAYNAVASLGNARSLALLEKGMDSTDRMSRACALDALAHL